MLEELVPPPVAAVETFDDRAPCTLFPAEEAVIAAAVDKRRREFTTARWCAREALRRLGYPAAPVLPGARGAPIWPAGIVGSITHCVGYRAAAVARASAVTTLGIDAEPHEPLPPDVLDTISLRSERSWVAYQLAVAPEVRWDRLLFCMKETVYKAWFPLTGRWLDFEQAEVSVRPATGEFFATLLVDGPVLSGGTSLRGFRGRWLVRRGLMLATIVVPVPA